MKADLNIAGICKKCPNFRTCKKPCPFVAKIADLETNHPPEKQVNPSLSMMDSEGDFIRIELKPRKSNREIYLSAFIEDQKESHIKEFDEQAYRDFFNSIENINENIEIFADKFFKGYTYKELSEKYGYTVAEVTNKYNTLIRRFINDIAFMEKEKRKKADLNRSKKMLNKKHGRFSPGLLQYLAFHIFDLSYQEVADLFDTNKSAVSYNINAYNNRVKNGEEILIYDEKGIPEKGINYKRKAQQGVAHA